ncbi:MAG: TetR/AcrR family transcriptional regulator [Alphaproteobacteria bacterium]|nr:TetR/AcrR family transcriptional regulator [Alphaproteobacteria bacterium]MDE2494137.1 TetR/AcrR family transcriptional regulator [Alphaproteobacteria bacterium]
MDTKRRIFLAARKRFERGGVDDVSMRNLAGDIGLTAMALYRHYPDKGSILRALTMDALDEWARCVEAIEAATPVKWLEKESEAFLDFALKTPRRFEAAFLLSAPLRDLPRVIDEGLSPPLNKAVAAIRQGQRDGLFCDEPPFSMFMNFWGLAQGLISLYRAERFSGGEVAFRAIYSTAIRRCLRSFLKEGVKS